MNLIIKKILYIKKKKNKKKKKALKVKSYLKKNYILLKLLKNLMNKLFYN